MRTFIIAAALVSLTAVPAFAGKTANASVSAGANNSVISRPVSVPSKPPQPPSLPSPPSFPSPRR